MAMMGHGMMGAAAPVWNPGLPVDPQCVGLWRFEVGQLVTDKSGEGNHLTNSGVASDTSDKRERKASGAFTAAENDMLYIADGSVSAGFPGKNGTTNYDVSVTAWLKLHSYPAAGSYMTAVYKGYPPNFLSWMLIVGNTAGVKTFRWQWSWNHTGIVEVLSDAGVALDTWYHVGATLKTSTKAYRLRIWDDSAGALFGAEKTGNELNGMTVCDQRFQIGGIVGALSCWDGHIDEVAVFNGDITAADIDNIRKGKYKWPK